MFEDRRAAGLALSERLLGLKEARPIICALLRGGAPVAAEIARTLGAPFRSILVRKISAPGHPEFAIGAIADGAPPTFALHRDIIDDLGIDDVYVEQAKTRALNEIERRRGIFYQSSPPSAAGRCVILVDDGLATGATMEAAIAAMRREGAARIIAAVPVAASEAAARIRIIADELITLEIPPGFVAVSAHYRRFAQLSDAEVVSILKEFAAPIGD